MITQLLHPTPHIKLTIITSNIDNIASEVADFIEPCSGTIDISLYNQEIVQNDSFNKIVNMKNYSGMPYGVARDYAAAIVIDVLTKHENKKRFLDSVYKILLNGCEIIVLEKECDIDEIVSLLDETEFRAVNYIDGVVDGYKVIVGKKLHMWGRGL